MKSSHLEMYSVYCREGEGLETMAGAPDEATFAKAAPLIKPSA